MSTEEEKIENFIEKQRKFHGYNERKDYNKAESFVTRKRDIGEEWIDEDGNNCVQKNGYIKRTKKKGDFSLMDLYRCKCGRIITNENEHNILVETGMCYKCHSKKETKDIMEGKEFEPPKWYKEIYIKDSFGVPRMHIDTVIEKVGYEKSIEILENLKSDIIKMSETKRINKHKLASIDFKLNFLKEKVHGKDSHTTSEKDK